MASIIHASPTSSLKPTKQYDLSHQNMKLHKKPTSVVVEFEQEFMSHLVVTDKSGRNTTMGEMLLPQYEKSLDDKSVVQFRLGDGK